jgi:TAG lipase/steryl ester hydrolase/phospholipase A2/LPA acyltransferase
MTFQEAFARSGRALSITVCGGSGTRRPRVLNYLTAPTVLVSSAVIASAAIPLLLPPVRLRVKRKDGSVADESDSPDACYKDGSLHGDLPLEELYKTFGVRFTVVSQVRVVLHGGVAGEGGASRWCRR